MSLLSGVPELQLDNPAGWKILRDALTMKEPNVLVLDPIGRMLGSYNENKNEEVGQVLNKLEQLLKDYASAELALILTHHSKKPDTMAGSSFDPLSPFSMRGASRFYADPNTIMMINRTREYRNSAGRPAWEVTARIAMRQAEPLPDLKLSVNDCSDLRVRFKNWLGDAPGEVKRKEESVLVAPVSLRGEQPNLIGFPSPVAPPPPWERR